MRERIASGDSDAQVIDFLVARYGEFVLLKPRFNSHTLLLWLLPPLALAGGERQADMEQAGGFDESAMAGGASSSAVVAAPAATPPRAVAAVRLSLTEASYVQAWMKATGRSR